MDQYSAWQYKAYGPIWGYLFGWSLLAIMETGSIAGIAMASATALSTALPAGLSDNQEVLLAHAMIWTLTTIHIVSVRVGIGILQNLFTFAKGVGILIVIVLGLACPTGSWSNLEGQGPLPNPGALVGIMGLLMMKALWGYDGWINATYIAGELKDSKKQVPRALIGATLLVLVLYCLTNLAFHFSLPPAALAASSLAAADVVKQSAGGPALIMVSCLIAFSTFGTLNGSIMSAPRVYFAMAADGLFFRQISAVHPRFQTPYVALLVQGLWSSALLLHWKSFEKITDNVMFVYFIFYALGAAAIFRFPRPTEGYVTPLRPLTAGIFIATAVLLTANTLYQNPGDSVEALMLIGVGLALYPFVRSGSSASSPSRPSPSR